MSLQLIGTNKANSTLLAYDGSTQQVNLFSAFGSVNNTQSGQLPGFNGQRPDPFTGVTHLGNGYRAYNPILMRFTCPDNESPFGVGGINPYAYCANDPVNSVDPNGHGFVYRTIKRGLTFLFKYIFEEAFAESMAKTMAKTMKITATYGTQIISIVTGVQGYEKASSDPARAVKLEKASKGLGIINAIVTFINAPMELAEDFENLHGRSGSYKPELILKESGGKISHAMKSERKITRRGEEGFLSLTGVTESEITDDGIISSSGPIALNKVADGVVQNIKHLGKDVAEAFSHTDLKTTEDMLLHDSELKTRPVLYLDILSNSLAITSELFSIESYAVEKLHPKAAMNLDKISVAVGLSGDVLDIASRLQSIKKHGWKVVTSMYEMKTFLKI